MSKGYTMNQISAVLGIKRDRMQDWYKKGFISASLRDEGQQGVARVFSSADILKIFLFRGLVKCGCRRKAAFEMLEGLDAEWLLRLEKWPFCYVACDTGSEFIPKLCATPKKLQELTERMRDEDWDQLRIFPLWRCKALLEKVERECHPWTL